MASTQKQKTTSGGSVAGLLNAPLPGSPAFVVSVAITRAALRAVRPSSSSRQAVACFPWLLPPFLKGPKPYTYLDRVLLIAEMASHDRLER